VFNRNPALIGDLAFVCIMYNLAKYWYPSVIEIDAYNLSKKISDFVNLVIFACLLNAHYTNHRQSLNIQYHHYSWAHTGPVLVHPTYNIVDH